MAQHDRNLLKRADVERFTTWLTQAGESARPGKGEYQLLQVKVGDHWRAICINAGGEVSTPKEIAPLIKLFKASGKPAQIEAKKAAPKSESAEFLNDLRDDFAMAAMQAYLNGHVSYYGHENHWTPSGIASEAYDVADAMMAERAKRIGGAA